MPRVTSQSHGKLIRACGELYPEAHDRGDCFPLRHLLSRIIVARRRLKMWGRVPSTFRVLTKLEHDALGLKSRGLSLLDNRSINTAPDPFNLN